MQKNLQDATLVVSTASCCKSKSFFGAAPQLPDQAHGSSISERLNLYLRPSATLAHSTVGLACRRREVCVQSLVAVGLQKRGVELSGL